MSRVKKPIGIAALDLYERTLELVKHIRINQIGLADRCGFERTSLGELLNEAIVPPDWRQRKNQGLDVFAPLWSEKRLVNWCEKICRVCSLGDEILPPKDDCAVDYTDPARKKFERHSSAMLGFQDHREWPAPTAVPCLEQFVFDGEIYAAASMQTGNTHLAYFAARQIRGLLLTIASHVDKRDERSQALRIGTLSPKLRGELRDWVDRLVTSGVAAANLDRSRQGRISERTIIAIGGYIRSFLALVDGDSDRLKSSVIDQIAVARRAHDLEEGYWANLLDLLEDVSLEGSPVFKELAETILAAFKKSTGKSRINLGYELAIRDSKLPNVLAQLGAKNIASLKVQYERSIRAKRATTKTAAIASLFVLLFVVGSFNGTEMPPLVEEGGRNLPESRQVERHQTSPQILFAVKGVM